MRPRATPDLLQLPDSEFLRQVSIGMRAVLANAGTLVEDGSALAEVGRHRSSRLLLAVAEEEAAQYMILLDAVRCERKGPNLARQLKRFNEHLAKGLYAKYAQVAPASFGEVLEFLERERKTLYLDGPSDVDWIFRNRILQDREEMFYVDYVESEGEHMWIGPLQPPTIDTLLIQPDVFTLATRLSAAGFDHPEALRTIAELWRGVHFFPESHWQKCHVLNNKTLSVLGEMGLLTQSGTDSAAIIAWDWLFPLHSVDLSAVQVGRKELEAARAARLTKDDGVSP